MMFNKRATEMAPVIHAHWRRKKEIYEDGGVTIRFHCSNCDYVLEASPYEAFLYCPHCGARMDE